MTLQKFKKYRVAFTDQILSNVSDNYPVPSPFQVAWNSENQSPATISFHKSTFPFDPSKEYIDEIIISPSNESVDEVIIMSDEDIGIDDTNWWIANGAIAFLDVDEPSFIVAGYNMSCEKHKLNKSSNILLDRLMVGQLRERSSVVNPTITIEYPEGSTPSFNYVYIPSFERYYYVTEIVFINNNLWSISLSVDVLMSFASDIILMYAEIERQEFVYNQELVDSERLAVNGYEVVIDEETTINPDTIFDVPTTTPTWSYVLGVYS